MGVKERVSRLRERMEEYRISVYIIPTNDFHGSEYVGGYFKAREYVSGFTGSAGTLVITKEEAGLWTDGRYFLQAEEQLADTGITLYKMGEEGVPAVNQFVYSKLPVNGVVGCDGRMVSAAWKEGMEQMLAPKKGTVNSQYDLAGEIWSDRPAVSKEKAWILPETYAGESRQSKIEKVQQLLKKREAQSFLFTSLDDIAWLLNIRGNDIPYNPVLLSYLSIEQNRCVLFAHSGAFTKAEKETLGKDNVVFREYEEIYDYVHTFPHESRILLDKRTINAKIVENFPEEIKIVDSINPVTSWKSVKNETEVENEKKAHIRDGVAVTKFLYWLKHNVDKMPLTEISAAEKLESFRKEQEHYLGPSFEPIAGYAEHGAIVHYSATKESNARLLPENFLLLDTGGQYLEGTTDITRTILLGGKATKEQKKFYTAVLRGNLNLCAAKFRYGCSGVALDYLAREPLWEMGCDYNHGTGHGVGYLLNVHEPANGFRYKILKGPGQNPVLEEGMITSDEPGIYLAGKYGIRLENLILCVKKEKTSYGQFMGFEPLTYVPFERDAIDKELMSDKEIALLNAYHHDVVEKIGGYLTRDEREWLEDVCAPLV